MMGAAGEQEAQAQQQPPLPPTDDAPPPLPMEEDTPLAAQPPPLPAADADAGPAPPPLPPLEETAAEPPVASSSKAAGASDAEQPQQQQQQQQASGPGPSSSNGGGAGGWDGGEASSSKGEASSSKGPPPPPEAITAKASAEEAALLKAFFGDMKDVDRDNEVNRIMWSFKLNPYERLNLRFTATPEEVRKQYRKLSLMVHPDKCKHEKAAEAFDILGAAQKELLDEGRREELWKVLEIARDDVRKERAKETKHDTTIELAALLHEKGKEGVQEQYEQTDEFHERWRLKARDTIARSAWRRQKLAKRLKDETERSKEEHEEMKQQVKKQREHEKKWESTRDARVGTWRDYMNKGSKKKSAGHIKPPKQKTFDEDKTYVQRPLGEQHRPPPPKPAGPKK